MKKIVFYTSNSFFCCIFLGIRYVHYLFSLENGWLAGTKLNLVHMITIILLILLFINIFFAYKEINDNHIWCRKTKSKEQ